MRGATSITFLNSPLISLVHKTLHNMIITNVIKRTYLIFSLYERQARAEDLKRGGRDRKKIENRVKMAAFSPRPPLWPPLFSSVSVHYHFHRIKRKSVQKVCLNFLVIKLELLNRKSRHTVQIWFKRIKIWTLLRKSKRTKIIGGFHLWYMC